MTAITTGEGTVLRLPADVSWPDATGEAADVTVAAVGPTGLGGVDPLVTVTRDGRTALHARCSRQDRADVVAALEAGDFPTAGADAVVDHDPGTDGMPAAQLPGLDTGDRRVLAGCGWRRPSEPADHEAAGGFVDVEPDAIREAAGAVRGRGWGDWCRDVPLVETWERAGEAPGDATVVVNAHGSTADALLLSSVPYEVLEGATAAARAVGADRVVVYVSAADDAASARTRKAVEAYPDRPIPVDVVEGPAEYRAAEPTMALEAIEGNHRLEARLRPPGPEEVGLDGRPTLVHTARTVAHLAVGLREGEPAGTRVVSVCGDVDAPATVELPESGSLAAVREAVDVESGFKAACVGGRFGGLTGSLDVAPGAETLVEAGLGTEGTVEVLGEDRCLVEFVGKRASYAADANCGRCVPCREGTTQLAELLRGLYDGRFEREKLEELERVMRTTSICTFGVDAGRPARTAVEEFESEFEAHADGRCPAGVCGVQEVSA